LGNLAEELSETGDTSKESHFKALIHRESEDKKFRHINYSEKKKRGGGVTVVEKDTENGRIRITNKDEIEHEIIRVNKAKLVQAHDTPLMMEPLFSLTGGEGVFDKWGKILNSEIQLPDDGIEEGTRLWFDFIQRQNTAPIDIDWTPQEYFDGWNKMKEKTGSAPGWHFGHLKCIDPESGAAEIISLLALLPLKTGYVPMQWRQGVNSMIPKKLHDLCPDKLRLILLMDCRFNHNNKIIGKKMMKFGEEHKLLAQEQYGSRKFKSAIDHALNKRLILDIIRQYRMSAYLLC